MKEALQVIAQIAMGWSLLMCALAPLTVIAVMAGMSKEDWREAKDTLAWLAACFLLGKMAWEAFMA